MSKIFYLYQLNDFWARCHRSHLIIEKTNKNEDERSKILCMKNLKNINVQRFTTANNYIRTFLTRKGDIKMKLYLNCPPSFKSFLIKTFENNLFCLNYSRDHIVILAVLFQRH